MYSRYILTSALLMLALKGYSQTDTASLDSIFKDEKLNEVKVVARKAGTSRLAGAVNGIAVNKDELFKAACCNLGESFTTNPSVDVAYNDATTGARQIKLLGLSGTYVQMLTENLPNFRGAAIPYALGYVPGPWMKGIQVSKGSASVKNGYESITGQINVDYLKPEDEQQVHSDDIYRIKLHTNRYEGYMKHAFILNHEHGTNIAFMSSASMYQLNAQYGNRFYDLNEKNLYGSLIFETNFTHQHNLSVGLSVNHDYLGQRANVNVSPRPTVGLEDSPYLLSEMQRMNEKETTPGAYAQYTYTLGTKLTAMAGVRFDHSSLYGSFFTPRFHVKYSPIDAISIRLSAGKGYRTVFGLAEYNYLLASGRNLNIGEDLKQEEAWNYGLSTAFYIPMFGKTLKLNAEYYYTDFKNQAVVDYDANKGLISICNLMGKSYSHTFQIDASYPLLKGLEITAAYRLNDVKCTYDYGKTLKEKPLTSKYKALFTASYKTPLDLWQFDATVQLNGGGRNPEPYQLADGSQSWSPRFHSFGQVSAQVTRWFHHWSIYVGGENLTGFKQKTPIYGASNPWGSDFEPTLVWGPVEGRMFYAGVRVHF